MVAPTRLLARVEHHTLDEFEAGFAPQVSASAVFLTADQLRRAGDTTSLVGQTVDVEILLKPGPRAVAFHGLVVWSYPTDAVPPGREAGTGIVVTRAEDAASDASLRRMRERPNAGARVRFPGAALAPTSVIVPAVIAPAAGGIPMPRLVGLLGNRALGDSDPESMPIDSFPPFELAQAGLLDAPTLDNAPAPDGRDDRSLPVPAPSVALLPAGPFSVEQLPDASPAGGTFEAHPTDVDLLASVDAADVVLLPEVGEQTTATSTVPRLVSDDRPPGFRPAGPGAFDTDDARESGLWPTDPPADDDVQFETLISRKRPNASASDEWGIFGGEQTLMEPAARIHDVPTDVPTDAPATRPLPAAAPWPVTAHNPSALLGVAFAVTPRRGLQRIEAILWPLAGTKRPLTPPDLGESLESEPSFAEAEEVPHQIPANLPSHREPGIESTRPHDEVFAADWPATQPSIPVPLASVATQPPISAAHPADVDVNHDEEERDTTLDLRRPTPSSG